MIFQASFLPCDALLAARLSHPRHDRTGPAGKIGPDSLSLIEPEPGPAQDSRHGFRPGGADLDEDPPRRRQDLAGTGGNAPIGVKPVTAAVQSTPWIELCHLFRQGRDLTCRKIRRVGEDQVELSCDRLEPIAGDKGGPIGHAQTSRIGRGKGESSAADVGAEAGRLRQLGQERDEDAAGPGAEIEQLERPSAPAVPLILKSEPRGVPEPEMNRAYIS